MNRIIKMHEEQKKKNEEIIRKNQQINEEKEKKQKLIQEQAKKKNINIDDLDNSLTPTKLAIGSGIATASTSILLFSGLAIFAINPVAGAIMAALGTYGTFGSGMVFIGSGIASLISKIIKI